MGSKLCKIVLLLGRVYISYSENLPVIIVIDRRDSWGSTRRVNLSTTTKWLALHNAVAGFYFGENLPRFCLSCHY